MNLKYINPYYKLNILQPRMLRSNANVLNDIEYEGFITPIFDRTEEDILKLKYYLNKGFKNLTDEEKQIWLNTEFKGALNVSDLNRIENNMSILAKVVEIQIETKTWVNTDIPNINTDFPRLKSNLELLKANVPLYENTPVTPELPWNTYQKINDVERIINDMYKVLTSQIKYYCGDNYSNSVVDIYCGEGMGLT